VPLLTACVFRFSQPPDAFIRPCAYWPYFIPDPLMGFSLQSFTPSAQPKIVSDLDTLLSLAYPGFPSALALLHYRTIQRLTSENADPKMLQHYRRKLPGPVANPAFRVLLHAKVCHLPWRFRPIQAHSSLGASPPSGLSPSLKRRNLHYVSPHAVTRKMQAPFLPYYRVLVRSEIGLSFSRLPTLMGFPTL